MQNGQGTGPRTAWWQASIHTTLERCWQDADYSNEYRDMVPSVIKHCVVEC